MAGPASDNPHPGRGSDDPGRIRLAPGIFVRDSDLTYSATRSSGPGGQNVNRRSTRVELRITLEAIPLEPGVRRRLERLAGTRLTAAGELLITSQDERSQKRNKDACLQKLRELVMKAQIPPKPRVKTKPGRGAIERRLREKKEQSERKQRRSNPPGW